MHHRPDKAMLLHYSVSPPWQRQLSRMVMSTTKIVLGVEGCSEVGVGRGMIRYVRIILLLLVYMVLNAVGQFASALLAALGAGAGIVLFALFFPLPPQSGPMAMVLIAIAAPCGLYAYECFGSKWERA